MLKGRFACLLAISLVFVGCDDGSDDDDGDDGGSSLMDAGPGRDAGRRDSGGDEVDAGPSEVDAGPRVDAGGTTDVDGGPIATACDPARGIECDGDWEGRCATACGAGECCSPLASSFGRSIFGCVPRDESGACPAADIWVDEARIEGNYAIEYRSFSSSGCALEEGCVDAPGVRRLLRFDTWTPNTGGADLYLGVPSDHPELFEYSPCHMHYHFNSYARYALHDDTGAVVARGHKQAFCLLDFYQYPGTDATGAIYECTNQGIQAGFQDVYARDLDCQWVDVTGVPAGNYVLRIEINFEGVLNESDYSNNTAEIPVVIPPETLTLDGPHACTPGETIEIGCSSGCGEGSCSGDPFMRVCDAAGGATSCEVELASDDDCGNRCRGNGGDCCPHTSVTCPASGSVNVFWASLDGSAATCNVAVSAP